MDQARRPRRGPRRDVVLLDERRPGARGWPRRAAAPPPTIPPPTTSTSHRSSARRREVGRPAIEARPPRGRRRSVEGPPSSRRLGRRPRMRQTSRPPCRRRGRRSASGVWKTTSGRPRQQAVRLPAPSTTRRRHAPPTSSTSREPGRARSPRPDVSHDRPPRGSRSGRRAPARRAPRPICVRSPVLGRWKVTVRSARTTGSDGSPEVRSTAVGVSTASTGTPAARAGGRARRRSGSGRGAGRGRRCPAGRRRRPPAFSIPWPRIATSRATGAWTLVIRRSPTSRSQLGPRQASPGGPRRDERDDDAGPAPRRRRAATNPSPPLLPGPQRIRIGPRSSRPLRSARACAAAATAVPACSMSAARGRRAPGPGGRRRSSPPAPIGEPRQRLGPAVGAGRAGRARTAPGRRRAAGSTAGAWGGPWLQA